MPDLYSIFSGAQAYGVYDIILPFLLIFTISFGILEKVQLFGAKKKNIHVILSLVIGLLFLQNSYLIFKIQTFLPNISYILIILLMGLLVFGIFTGPQTAWANGAIGIAFFIAIIAVIYSLFANNFGPGLSSTFPDFFYSNPWVIGLIILIAVIAFVARGDRDPNNPPPPFWTNFTGGGRPGGN